MIMDSWLGVAPCGVVSTRGFLFYDEPSPGLGADLTRNLPAPPCPRLPATMFIPNVTLMRFCGSQNEWITCGRSFPDFNDSAAELLNFLESTRNYFMLSPTCTSP